jgi:hypothetical protein
MSSPPSTGHVSEKQSVSELGEGKDNISPPEYTLRRDLQARQVSPALNPGILPCGDDCGAIGLYDSIGWCSRDRSDNRFWDCFATWWTPGLILGVCLCRVSCIIDFITKH